MDRTGGRLDETRQRAQRRRLPAPGGAQQGEELSGLDVQVKVRDGNEIAEGDFDVV